jgi:hypothetical protein
MFASGRECGVNIERAGEQWWCPSRHAKRGARPWQDAGAAAQLPSLQFLLLLTHQRSRAVGGVRPPGAWLSVNAILKVY